ncbi:MAG: hypothetical protein B6229_02540 [Spirochaetaceae bacterium 4572_7]|nr:MAG: hypothetical protein B6229_02540 [Spirochaetaceae bacterium 4572_7]
MNRVLISLLKGATKNKILLYNMDFSKEEMIEIINSGELKKVYNLSKGSNFSRLQEILDFLNKEKIATVIITDDIYPESLKEIFDPPFLLYVRGNVDALKGNLVSIVGTRKPSLKGLYGAYELGLDFGRYNIGVVSLISLKEIE